MNAAHEPLERHRFAFARRVVVAGWLGEGVRYLAASVAALALDASLLWLLVARAEWPAWAGGAVAYLAGLALVYALSVRWVFARRAVRDRRVEFVVFAALGLLGLVMNSVVLTVAIALGLSLFTAKVAAAGLGFATNFASRKALLFTFRRRG